jgi:hypothetical protein
MLEVGRLYVEYISHHLLQTKSSRLRYMIDLWSHSIRPAEFLKPDLQTALRRKWPRTGPTASTMTLSPVRFQSKNREIAPVSRNFQRIPGGFLCTSDFMAEEGVLLNFSPAKFPANREKYREFREFPIEIRLKFPGTDLIPWALLSKLVKI